MTSVYEDLGLKRVINASGKMTALGGTAQRAAVAESLALAAASHVDMAELRRLAGRKIAQQTGAQAASVTSGAAAGIAIGVAAMITGSDDAAIRRLPDSGGLPDEIVLQAGHDVDFGATVTQMIRLGGGRPIVAGTAEGVSVADLETVFSERTAGMLFVQSHHTRQSNGLSLSSMLEVGRRRRIPVLVDAAAEEDLAVYVTQGADLVTYSGGKAICGPTVGFIAGSRDLVASCERQNRGIARAMKVGKEQIIGLLTALDDYPSLPEWPVRLEALHEALSQIDGIHVSLEDDLAGRDIRRVGIRMASPAALEALVGDLAAGDPSIRTRNHQLGDGLVLFDVREVKSEDIPVIARRVRELLNAIDQERP